MVALRLVAAAWTPLTFDEAYYWMWSKHLAGGYYDHPPMVAYVIRAGTIIAGDTELGVRLVSILLALPMSFAVYQSAGILFGGRRVAATAAILLNVTLMAAVGTLIVTPDAPLLVASSFVLLFCAKVLQTGQPEIVPAVSEAWLSANAQDGRHLKLLHNLAPRSLLCVPLKSGDRMLGAITFASSEAQRRYDADDLLFVKPRSFHVHLPF